MSEYSPVPGDDSEEELTDAEFDALVREKVKSMSEADKKMKALNIAVSWIGKNNPDIDRKMLLAATATIKKIKDFVYLVHIVFSGGSDAKQFLIKLDILEENILESA